MGIASGTQVTTNAVRLDTTTKIPPKNSVAHPIG